jgi:hypothetical protein
MVIRLPMPAGCHRLDLLLVCNSWEALPIKKNAAGLLHDPVYQERIAAFARTIGSLSGEETKGHSIGFAVTPVLSESDFALLIRERFPIIFVVAILGSISRGSRREDV